LLAPAWDSVVSLGYKELHLTGHGCPIQPVEVKMFSCVIHAYMYRDAKQNSSWTNIYFGQFPMSSFVKEICYGSWHCCHQVEVWIWSAILHLEQPLLS